jgi:integrase
MAKLKGIYQRGNNWRINTAYKGQKILETCASRDSAETTLSKIKTLIDEGRWLQKRKITNTTLKQVTEKYLEWCKQINQPSAYDKAVYSKPILDHFGGKTLIHTITRAGLEKYQSERLATVSERRKRTVSPATVNREIAMLRHLFTKAVEWELIDGNPALGIKMLKEENQRLRFLSGEEIQALLSACPLATGKRQPTLRQIITLALHTGMRKSEILNLQWPNVDLKLGHIELTDQKNGQHSFVPLSPECIEMLRKIPRRVDSPYVFPGRKAGHPFSDLKAQFNAAVKKAGLEDVTFHTLRHTAASHLVMSGADLATVRDILRHKSFVMTLRYAHLSDDHRKQAVAGLAKALAARPQAGDGKSQENQQTG